MKASTLARHSAWVLLAVASLSFILMLPRLADAHFGLFDDSTTLIIGRRILDGSVTAAVEASRGRLRPLYWLYYALVQGIAGRSAIGFFLANAVLLTLTTWLLGWISRALAKSLAVAVTAQLLFLLSGPVVENAYTLSKPELQQAIWILLSLALAIHSTSGRARGSPWIYVALVAGVIVLAGLTKETTPLLAVVAAAWVVRSWAFERLRLERDPAGRKGRVAYLLATILAVGLILGLQGAAGSVGNISRGYPSGFEYLDGRAIRANAWIWADWLTRDYLYLAFLVPSGMLAVIGRRVWRDLGLQLDALIWLAVWLGIYLPWKFTPEYYLLPFGLGAAFLGATSAGALVRWAMLRRAHWIAWGAVGTAAAFFLLTLPNLYTSGRAQLEMDAATAVIIEFAATNLPENSALLVNIQEPNDFTDNFPAWINVLLDRPDIVVDYYRFQDLHATYGSDRPIFFALPVVENQFYPSVRLGVHELASRQWNEALTRELDGHLDLTFGSVHRFRSMAVDASCLFRKIAGPYAFCQNPDMPVDSRRFGFGWELYQLNGEAF